MEVSFVKRLLATLSLVVVLGLIGFSIVGCGSQPASKVDKMGADNKMDDKMGKDKMDDKMGKDKMDDKMSKDKMSDKK